MKGILYCTICVYSACLCVCECQADVVIYVTGPKMFCLSLLDGNYLCPVTISISASILCFQPIDVFFQRACVCVYLYVCISGWILLLYI